jgi:competence protein ComEC
MTRYPGPVACLLLILGITFGSTVHLPDFIAFCIIVFLFILALIALHRRSRLWAVTAVACSLILLGIFRYNLLATNFPPNHISWFTDLPQETTVKGRIIREPDMRPDKTLLTVECDTLVMNGKAVPVSGLLLVRINRLDERFNYADHISVTGFVRTPLERRNFHGFDYRRYLRLKRVNSYVSIGHSSNVRVIEGGTGNWIVSKVIIPLRRHILDVFEKHICGSERYLIAGFLIGETRFIPQQIYERFRDTGTLHLLAVSGSNVALVIITVMFLFRIIGAPRRLVDILSLIVIVIFCQLSFNQPSVVRASLMIGLVITGRILYRKGSLLNIIAVAALFILLYDPLMLYDVGFQLSFAAAFSLIYFLKGLMPKQRRYPRWKRWVKDYGWMIVLSSIVVQLTVAPILAYYFGTIPLITFISNLVVIPLSSVAVILSLLLIVFAPIPFLSDLIAIVAQFFLHLSIKAVDLFASLPLVKLTVAAPDTIHILFYYAVLFAFFSAIKSRRNLRYLVLLLLVWGNVIIWRGVARGIGESPAVTFFDLGYIAGLHLHVPPDYDMILTNAMSEHDLDQIERVLRPYIAGENIDDLDIWAKCTPLQSDSFDLERFIEASPVPVDSDYSTGSVGVAISDDGYSIRLLKSQHGIEMASFDFGDKLVVWLSDWEQLTSLEPDDHLQLEVLALPYPFEPIASHLDPIGRLDPDRIVIYSYPWSPDRSDLDFLERELDEKGIALLDTRRYGAIRLSFSRGETVVKHSALGD